MPAPPYVGSPCWASSSIGTREASASSERRRARVALMLERWRRQEARTGSRAKGGGRREGNERGARVLAWIRAHRRSVGCIRANSGGLGGLQLRTPRVKENGINVCFGLGLGRGRFFLCSDISVQGLL
jgi:hypothetical protein